MCGCQGETPTASQATHSKTEVPTRKQGGIVPFPIHHPTPTHAGPRKVAESQSHIVRTHKRDPIRALPCLDRGMGERTDAHSCVLRVGASMGERTDAHSGSLGVRVGALAHWRDGLRQSQEGCGFSTDR